MQSMIVGGFYPTNDIGYVYYFLLIIYHVTCREVHHMCVLLGYGADAICPYLVFETMNSLLAEGVISSSFSEKDIFKVSYYFITMNCL